MATLTSMIDFESVFRQIPYLQGTDLDSVLAKFHQHFKGDIEKSRANLLRSLGGWKKPFYLVFDSLSMPSIPNHGMRYKSYYTFALQWTDGLCFQVAFLEASFCNNDSLEEMGPRWKRGLQDALEALHVSGDQLVEQAEEFYPKILCLLSLKEAKRFT